MMEIHLPTLLLGTSLSTLCLFLCVVIVAHFATHAPGVAWWGFGGIAIAAALIGFVVNLLAPTLLGLILSHICIATGIAMFGYGTALFTTRRFPWPLYAAALAIWLVVAITGLATGVFDEKMRVTIAGLCGGVLLVHAARELGHAPQHFRGRALPVLRLLVLLTGALFLMRGVLRALSVDMALLVMVETIVSQTLFLVIPVVIIALVTEGLGKSLTTMLKTVQREARIDILTGARNRRSFDRAFDRAFRQFKRYERPCSLVLIDLDHFKAINDGHGHITGDNALRLLVQTVQSMLRDVDAIYRLGGDEFVVLLPETPAGPALQAADRLCRAIAAQSVFGQDGALVPLSASLGLTDFRNTDITSAEVYDRADRALYFAKAAGRGRAELY
jgi:diguanylate cyclase (GGDEF)-like protein